MATASALLTVGLRFSVRSGQNTAGLPLELGATRTAAPGLWISADLFRQRGWRMIGSSWGISSVFLLSPRGGIAGVFLLILFLMVPAVLPLPWAPSGRCPELLPYGGFGMWLLSRGREASSAAHGSVLDSLCARDLPTPF